MIRLVLAAWLALCGVANAQLSGGVGGFPGPGTAHTAGGAAPAYTYIGATSSTGSGAGISQSFALGSNPTCKVVVAVNGQNASAPTVTVSVGGVGLVQDTTQTNTISSINAFLFSKDLASCTGSQTVAMTSTGGSFTYRSISVYVLTNTVSSTVVQTGGYIQNSGTLTPASPTIPVVAGGILLVAGRGNGAATITTCSGASVAPSFPVRAVGGASASDFTADWTIASTNASFAPICNSSSGDNAVVAATYR